jgi:hypothetical protein
MGTFQVPGRVSGKTYNLKIKGDTPSATEQERIRAFIDEKENAFAADYEARYGAPLAVDDGTALGRGFEMGKAGAYSRLGTTAEYIGSGLGLESLANFGRGMREEGDYEAFLESLRQPAPTRREDVTGIGSALTYVGEGIGQSIPEAAAPLLATIAGTAAGTVATGNPITGTAIGIGAGTVTGLPSFFGGNIQRQEEEVAAGRKEEVDVADAIIGAIGQATINSVADKFLILGILKPGQKWLTRTVTGAAEGAVAEVPSEITQTMIERFQAGLPLDNDEAISEYIDAGILGGVMGGGIRATTAGLGVGMERPAAPPAPPGTTTPPPVVGGPATGAPSTIQGVMRQGPRVGPADNTTVTLNDGTKLTLDGDATEADIAAAVDQHNQTKAAQGAKNTTVQVNDEIEAEQGVDYEVIPDEAYAADARANAGTYTDEELAGARDIYDERLAAAEEGGANPDEARRVAAQAAVDYVDSLQDEAKQRLARFRSTMARVANPKYGNMPPEVPDEAYAQEFGEAVQKDLFDTAQPAATKVEDRAPAETEAEIFDRAEAKYAAERGPAPAPSTNLEVKKFADAAAEADARAEADAATRTATEIVDAPKPAQVLTDELVTELGVRPDKSAALRKLVGKPLTATKVIQALNSWAQSDKATPDNKALAARLITGQPAPEVSDVTTAAETKPEEVGAGVEGGGQGVEGGGGAADITGGTAGTETSERVGLGDGVPDAVGTTAAAGKQPATLSELEEQLAAARAEAAALRKKVPAGVMERELVGGAVDPKLAKTVDNLQNVLSRQEKAAETAKNAVPKKPTHPARPKKLIAYEEALAKVADTRRQLAVAQEALSAAELAASLQRGAQPKARATGKAATTYTNYIKALRRADVLRQQVESARAQQTTEAKAPPPLPTGLQTGLLPELNIVYPRGGAEGLGQPVPSLIGPVISEAPLTILGRRKVIPPAAAVKAVADDVRKETVFRRLIQYFKQRATPSMLQYTTIGNGINDPAHWKTLPDWMPINDQSKVAALLGRLNRVEREKYKFTLAEVEPLSSDAEAAHTYFSKTIRPVDAIDLMVADLTVDYEIYEGSLRPGQTEIEVRDLLAGTGSDVAKRALNWVRANLSPETNAEIDLVLKKQADDNAPKETALANIDRVAVTRAKRKAAKAAQAEAAAESGYGPFEVASAMAAADSLVALDKELHYSVVAALNAGDLKGALRALAATTNNADLKALASRFSELTGTTRVKVLYPGDPARNINNNKGIYWQYDGLDPNNQERRNIIYLNGQTGMTAHVLMHEMAHAVTMNFIETQPNHPVVKQLESLLQTLRGKVSPSVAGAPGDFYGLRNVKEMVAEGYGRIALGDTDNGLRDLMKRTMLRDLADRQVEYENPLNAWDRFKEIVGNIFNVIMRKPLTRRPRTKRTETVQVYETAADRFHRLVDGILSEAPQVLPDAVLQRAVASPMVSRNVLNNAIKSAPVWDAAGRSRLAELMMSSVPVGLRRALLAPLQLEWFNDLAGKYFPQIAELKVFDDLRRGNIRRLEQAASPVITDLAKYAEAEPELYATLMSIMGTATRLGVDPTKPQSVYAADPEKIRVWHDLNRMLPRDPGKAGEMRKLFETTRALFESYRNEMLDVLRTRVKELTDDTAMQNQIYKRLVDKLDADGVIDPYFSLMRKGDHWLVYSAEDNTAGAVAVDPFGRPQRPTTQFVQAFDSAWARNAFRAKLEATKDANGKPVAWDIKESRRPKTNRHVKGYVPPEFVQGAINIINTTVPKTTLDPAAEQRAVAAREAIEDLFLSFLPEQSIMKSFSKRKGVRGFIGDITPIGVVDRPQDMVSMLENKSHSIAFQLSNMKYGSEIQRLMNQADETYKTLRESNLSAGEAVAVDAYHEEFMARAAFAKSPTVSDTSQILRGITFGFTLGANIAGAANNLMQIAMVGIPELAARYGGVRAARRELGSAGRILMNAGKTQNVMSYGPKGRTARELTSVDNYGSAANYYTPTVRKNAQTGAEEFGYDLRTDINIPDGLRDKLANMDVLIEVMANNDMLGGSTNQELLEATSDWWRKINRWSGFLMHHTERFNRQTIAIAAYNLELGRLTAAGATPDYATKLAAAKKAVEITENVNGSIGAAQGSRLSFGTVGSLVMMYKRFGMMMTRYLINNTKQALKKITPGMSQADIDEAKKERAIARYQITGVLGAAALFSGVQGLPFFGEVMTLLELFFTEDDEEPPKVLIQKFLGEPYYHGALNYLLGIDIASRISLSGLIFRENKIDKDQSVFYDAIEMFGGPAVGLAMNLERGYDLISEGETYRGVEAMVPSAIKSAMKSVRFGTEGATTVRGDEIVPLSSLDLVKQFIGYTPEAYARQQERTSLTKRMDEAVREKKRKLLRKYNLAVEDGDFAEVRDVLRDMREFSREYPEDAIGADTLKRSLRGFRQRSEEMIGGVSFNRVERARSDIEEFDADTTLFADLTT